MSEDVLNLILSRLAAIDAKADPSDANVVARIMDLHAEVHALGARIGSLELTTAAMDGRISALDARFVAFETKINSRFAAIDDRFDFIDGRLAKVEAKVDQIDIDLGGLRKELSIVRSDVMARIDRLQNTVDPMRDDISTNFFRGDVIERQPKNAFAEAQGAFLAAQGATDETRALANQVSSMQRAMMKLAARVDELQPKN
jgi:chromosome segregation ATPase